jgi:putative glutamine amidotransferase
MVENRRPVIGVTPAQQLNEDSVTVWAAYLSAVWRAGGLPVVLPVIGEPPAVAMYAAMLDGLLLTGGVDIDCCLYGQEPLAGFPVKWDSTPERDDFEIGLTRAFMAADKPVLGICRGHQLIAVAAGGSLYQDVSLQTAGEKGLRHFQAAPWWHPTHGVELAAGSKLAALFGPRVRVNSLHHQAVDRLPAGFRAGGTAADGTVEGLESMRHRFVVGVQWHPEVLVKRDASWLALFAAFVAAAAEGME